MDAQFSAPTGEGPVDFAVTLLQSGGAAADDYSYFENTNMANWADLGHWKHSRSSKPDEKKEEKKRVPKEKFLIDFSQPVDESALAVGAPAKYGMVARPLS